MGWDTIIQRGGHALWVMLTPGRHGPLDPFGGATGCEPAGVL